MLDSNLISTILNQWKAGTVVVHPTESLPGISANPDLENFYSLISGIKGEDRGQTPPLSLVDSLQTAKLYWQQLPPAWDKLLTEAWPGHLSIVFKASKKCPQLLCSKGYVGLRFSADLSPQMQVLLKQLKSPWPSTSVNQSGSAPIENYEEAIAFTLKTAANQKLSSTFLPPPCSERISGPSTVLKITGPQTGKLLRTGDWFKNNKKIWSDYGLEVEV